MAPEAGVSGGRLWHVAVILRPVPVTLTMPAGGDGRAAIRRQPLCVLPSGGSGGYCSGVGEECSGVSGECSGVSGATMAMLRGM